jgi:hypothetical protein
MSEYQDTSIYSPYWAYNRPGWKPCCMRCNQSETDCKKYNSNELGTFAGEWIRTSCVRDTDYKTLHNS